jgi:GntR family transcriptional regulator, transcriptional repressor for pyruvate dehydrogenase complex
MSTRRQSAFRPLRPPRNLTSELITRLSEAITSGSLSPNDRLPTEHEMIASFGVSRTVVREALAVLRAEGLVQTCQGSGILLPVWQGLELRE